MTDVRLKISPPWVTYVNKLQAIFDEDPQIAFNVDYNGDDGPAVILSTNNPTKAVALSWLLPAEKYFGNVTLEIGIDCSAPIPNRVFETPQELFEAAFENNPVFAYIVVPAGEYWYPPLTYVVFKNCVVQFFNDNLNDPHGVISTLYQDIADEIFEDMPYQAHGGIAYCTDVEHNLGYPIGEWT